MGFRFFFFDRLVLETFTMYVGTFPDASCTPKPYSLLYVPPPLPLPTHPHAVEPRPRHDPRISQVLHNGFLPSPWPVFDRPRRDVDVRQIPLDGGRVSVSRPPSRPDVDPHRVPVYVVGCGWVGECWDRTGAVAYECRTRHSSPMLRNPSLPSLPCSPILTWCFRRLPPGKLRYLSGSITSPAPRALG